MAKLPQEVVDLVEAGVSILVGTRDAAFRPATVRGVGAAVDSDRGGVTVFLPEQTAERAIRNLLDNGEIAVGFSRPFDNLAIQLKGHCASVRRAREDEQAIPQRYTIAFAETTYTIGLPRGLIGRMTCWPAWAARFEVRDIFSQTPGPGAGKRWEPR